MKPVLLIIAAGLGTRYGGLKQLEGVGPHDEIMMDYSIHDAQKAGFGKAVLIVQEHMIPILTERYKHIKNFPIEFAIQEKEIVIESSRFVNIKPWGTAHALWCAKTHIEGNFLSINADDFYGQRSFQLAYDHFLNLNRPCAIVFPILITLSEQGTVNRAEVTIKNGLLIDSVEREKIRIENGKIIYQGANNENKEMNEHAFVSMNMWGFTPDIFDFIDNDIADFIAQWIDNQSLEYQLPKVVSSMIKNNRYRVDAITTLEEWIGVTYRNDKDNAAQKIKKLHDSGVYQTPLWEK